MAHQHERCFEAVIHFELIEDIGQMSFDGFFADENLLADLLVGQSFGDEPQDLQLPFGQRFEIVV